MKRISRPSGESTFTFILGAVNGVTIGLFFTGHFQIAVYLMLVLVNLIILRTAMLVTRIQNLDKRDTEAFDKLLLALHNLDEAKDRIGLNTEELT